MMTNWTKAITKALDERGETFGDVESITLNADELEEEFNCGYGSEEGRPFTAWTRNYVYFPVCYDGAEWVGSVPRNPNGEPTTHIGG
jgi:hypothetical protein